MSEALRSELENFLDTLNIRTSCVEHPPVRTRTEARKRHRSAAEPWSPTGPGPGEEFAPVTLW